MIKKLQIQKASTEAYWHSIITNTLTAALCRNLIEYVNPKENEA